MPARKTLLVATAVALGLPSLASAAVLPPAVIDTDVTTANDIAIAPDGSGALVYAKANKIYASILAGGQWGAPVRIDPDDGVTEDQPRVGVGNGGRVLVAYRQNTGSRLSGRLLPAAGQALGAEFVLRETGGANRVGADWDLDMNAAGAAFAGWSEVNPGTFLTDARAWGMRADGTVLGSSLRLQQDPNTDGIADGNNGPDIRVAVDGQDNGILQFTMDGGVNKKTLVRRLTGVTGSPTFVDVTVPSVLGEALSGQIRQLDLAAGGSAVVAAGAGMYPNGGHAVGVPVTGETAGAFGVLDAYDASSNDNVERPDVSLNASGVGIFTSEPNQGAGVFGGVVGSPAQRIDVAATEPAGSEIPVTAIGDSGRGIAAWTRDVPDGAQGPKEVRGRLFTGTAFAPDEVVLSSAALGQAEIPFSVATADGAGASRNGDAALLMIQTDAGNVKRLAVGRWDAPPTAPTLAPPPAAPTARPTISWNAAEDLWSGIKGYKVVVDEAVVASVGADARTFTVAADLAPGAHTYRVIAVDTLDQETSSNTLTIQVPGGPGPTPTPTPGPAGPDRTKPTVSLKITGTKKVRRKLTLAVKATDKSGIRTVKLTYAGKSTTRRKGFSFKVSHRFARARKYTIKVTATDKKGNVRTLSRTVTIKRR